MASESPNTQVAEGPVNSSYRGSRAAVREGYQRVVEGLLGPVIDDPHTADTPERAASALMAMCSGLFSPPPAMRMFPGEGPPQMIVLGDIPVRSLCAHHLLPFVGIAVVGYIPDPSLNQVFGLSKLSRAVNYWARRPQVQERLTNQVADFLWKFLDRGHRDRGGVGVVVKANHACMEVRGVEHPGNMVTSALRGCFEEGHVKAEFMALARRWIK